MVFIEAGLCSKACLATNVGGIPDIIINEQTGLLIHDESPDEIAKAMVRLLSDKKFCKDLGVNAKKRVETHFLLQSIIQKQINIYHEKLSV